MKKKNTSKNPKSTLKKKLASRFLRSMKKLRMAEKGRRSYHAIRAAAYASMASAVGPRRAWSRALLSKIRNHKVMVRGRKKNPRRFGHDDGLSSDLSQLVPGGKAMDSCTLLNETAHYMKCLAAQVQIMTEILHYSSKH